MANMKQETGGRHPMCGDQGGGRGARQSKGRGGGAGVARGDRLVHSRVAQLASAAFLARLAQAGAPSTYITQFR